MRAINNAEQHDAPGAWARKAHSSSSPPPSTSFAFPSTSSTSGVRPKQEGKKNFFASLHISYFKCTFLWLCWNENIGCVLQPKKRHQGRLEKRVVQPKRRRATSTWDVEVMKLWWILEVGSIRLKKEKILFKYFNFSRSFRGKSFKFKSKKSPWSSQPPTLTLENIFIQNSRRWQFFSSVYHH